VVDLFYACNQSCFSAFFGFASKTSSVVLKKKIAKKKKTGPRSVQKPIYGNPLVKCTVDLTLL